MRRALTAAVLILAATPAAAGADLNCVVLPDEEVDVSSPVPGLLEEVRVRRGERVERGQVVARLESSVEEAGVALASARAATDAEIQLRRVELRYDSQHRDRLRALHSTSAVSAQNREDGERAVEAARLRVRLAEDRRREAELERRRADAVLALKTIRSPIAGVVVQRLRTAGEFVEDQPIVRIVRLDPLRVEVIAPLALFGAVHVGMQMGIRPETDPDGERVATVVAVDPLADPGSGTFGVELELPNSDRALLAGIKCKGRLLARIAAIGAGPPPAHGGVAKRPAAAAVEQASTGGPVAAGVAPFSEPAPVVESTGACLAYDALDDEAQAGALAVVAERLGGRASTTQVSETIASGYLVLARADAGPQDALMARLRAAGITDLARIVHGDHAGRVSVGVYDRSPSAERRQAALAARGFDTDVRRRRRMQSVWRVEVRLPAGISPETARDALAGASAGSPAQAGACEPLRTAAR